MPLLQESNIEIYNILKKAVPLSYPGVRCGSAVPFPVEVVRSTPHRPRRTTGPTWTATSSSSSSGAAATSSFLVHFNYIVKRHAHFISHNGLQAQVSWRQRTSSVSDSPDVCLQTGADVESTGTINRIWRNTTASKPLFLSVEFGGG